MVNIPVQDFYRAVRNENHYTNPDKTEYILDKQRCAVGQFIMLEIRPKDSFGNRKNYLGDYFNVRLVQKGDKKKYQKMMLLETKQITASNTYLAKIPCFMVGQFTVEVHMIRAAETQEMVRRTMAGTRQKHRIWSCSVCCPRHKVYCGPGPIFLQENRGIPVCAVDKTPGMEFFVRAIPNNKLEEKNVLDF